MIVSRHLSQIMCDSPSTNGTAAHIYHSVPRNLAKRSASTALALLASSVVFAACFEMCSEVQVNFFISKQAWWQPVNLEPACILCRACM